MIRSYHHDLLPLIWINEDKSKSLGAHIDVEIEIWIDLHIDINFISLPSPNPLRSAVSIYVNGVINKCSLGIVVYNASPFLNH